MNDGNKKRPGFCGIDMVDHGQEILWDVREGIPVPDGTVTHIFSSHFIEHLTWPEVAQFFDELLRVGAVGAEIHIKCPHASSAESRFTSHFSLWEELTVKGIVQGYRGAGLPKRFEIVGRSITS